MKDLTPEMEKQVEEFDANFCPEQHEEVEPKDELDKHHNAVVSGWNQCRNRSRVAITQAMHSIRKEAQLELIEEMMKRVRNLKQVYAEHDVHSGYNIATKDVLFLLTTKEESLKEELK